MTHKRTAELIAISCVASVERKVSVFDHFTLSSFWFCDDVGQRICKSGKFQDHFLFIYKTSLAIFEKLFFPRLSLRSIGVNMQMAKMRAAIEVYSIEPYIEKIDAYEFNLHWWIVNARRFNFIVHWVFGDDVTRPPAWKWRRLSCNQKNFFSRNKCSMPLPFLKAFLRNRYIHTKPI